MPSVVALPPKIFTSCIVYILTVIYYTSNSFGAHDEDTHDRIIDRDALLTQPSMLIREEVDPRTFLNTHSLYNKYTVSKRETNLTSLVYVTPWNNHGYDMAKIFAAKFAFVSPVWFQIKGYANDFVITGAHDIDQGWISDVRLVNQDLKFVPRILFDAWRDADFAQTFRNEKYSAACIRSTVEFLKKHKFDGSVIEIWSQHSGTSQDELVQFLIRLSEAFHNDKLILILVVPPPFYSDGYEGRFNRHHFRQLTKYIDYFSLMTYDYSSPMHPGPNSPIDWFTGCIQRLVPSSAGVDFQRQRSQLLAGLNFYGMEYVPQRREGKPILGHEFVSLVSQHMPKFHWHKAWAEHHISFNDIEGQRHDVYYPTLFSIAQRLSKLMELGTGVSIWEIGQGLDSFYTLL